MSLPMSEMPTKIERARSGRSRCGQCHKPIADGELRFGRPWSGELPPPEVLSKISFRWFHLRCAAKTHGWELHRTLARCPPFPERDELLQTTAGCSPPRHGPERGNLFAAIGARDPAWVSRCIEDGADTEQRNSDGLTPLHVAVDLGDVALVDAMVAGGAALDARTNERWTPLHVAADRRHWKVLVRLLALGANPDLAGGIENEARRTPLHFVLERAKWADVLPPVRALLSAGASPNLRDAEGHTPLRMAAEQGLVEVCEALLEAGAKVDGIGLGWHGCWTPLHHAARAGRVEAAKLLLARGAVPNAPTGEGKQWRQLSKGGWHEIIVPKGATPLDLARAFGHVELVELLQISGGQPSGVAISIEPSR